MFVRVALSYVSWSLELDTIAFPGKQPLAGEERMVARNLAAFASLVESRSSNKRGTQIRPFGGAVPRIGFICKVPRVLACETCDTCKVCLGTGPLQKSVSSDRVGETRFAVTNLCLTKSSIRLIFEMQPLPDCYRSYW